MKLAVVTCFYNFGRFSRPETNLHRFLRQMKRDGAAVYGVEAYAMPHAPVCKIYKGWKSLLVDHRQRLWQKEAALNIAETMVPPEYDAIAWIDADVWFSNPNWIRDTEKALETHDVVQLFETAKWTSRNGTIELTRDSVIKTPPDAAWTSHPGFAWAMRRDLWQKLGGLYPYALSGGGDGLMLEAWTGGRWPGANHMGSNPGPFNEWKSRAGNLSCGFVKGECFHEWHGSRKDRQYVTRADRVSKLDVGAMLEKDRHGLLRWAPNVSSEIVRMVGSYFDERKEDGA